MNNCKSIENKLMAYLHGELSPCDTETMQVHLDGCATCRAALEAQRVTLELLGEALGTASAPEKLTTRRHLPNRAPAHRPSFADLWFSPQFKAVCYASVFAAAFLFFSGTLVVFKVNTPPEVCFEAPGPVEFDGDPEFAPASVKRPKMPLKKLKVPTEISKGDKPEPRLRKRIVAHKSVTGEPEIIMPEIEGVVGGLGNMGGDGFGSLGFDLADGDNSYGRDESLSFGITPATSPVDSRGTVSRIADHRREPQRVNILAEMNAPVNLPTGGKVAEIPLKPLSIDPSKYAMPRSTAAIAAGVANVDINSINFPDLASSGIGGGDSVDHYVVGYSSYDTSGAASEEKKNESVVVAGEAQMGAVNGRGLQSGDYFFSDVDQPKVADEWVPLQVEYPRPLFAGTPTSVFLRTADEGRAENEQDGITSRAFGGGLVVGSDHSGLAGESASRFAYGWDDDMEDVTLGEPVITTKSGSVSGVEMSVKEMRDKTVLPEAGMDGLEQVSRGDDLYGAEIEANDIQAIIDYTVQPEDVPERLKKRKPAEFNPYVRVAENAFSTFSIDVDTAAYGLARQQLLAGALPEPESVRTEEFINSFDYDYRPPAGKQTFAVHNEVAPSPFRSGMDLLKVGIKGRRIGRDDHRGAVLTLVIDTSGSMSTPERMGLVKKSLMLLLDELDPRDKVAIVQFGGEARLVLDHTPVEQKEALLNAVTKLQPGGPTQFDLGLELGYAMATGGFTAGASNRIIIMSDGVANVGELDPEAMLEKVGENRRKGIYLSVLGFGAGTYDDDLLERLANRGDGMYAYIDSLDEARRLLVDQLAATLHVIASDVKIQVEFNPERVLSYRQLGYENRQLTKEQFRDDTVDAGEVGSGQSVTALYDIELNPAGDPHDPIATVYVRYRRADNGAIEEISSHITDAGRRKRFDEADPRFQLAACTAEFAERLRRSPYAEGSEMTEILGRLQPVASQLELDAQVQELLRLILIAYGLGN